MPATTAAATKPEFRAVVTDRYFYAGMSVAVLATVFVGFARSYFLREYFPSFPGRRSLTPLLHLHALLNSAWLLLFFAQTALIASRHREWHKKLGVAAAALVPLMVVVGMIVAIRDSRWGAPLSLVFLPFPICDLLIFSGFTAAALWYRRTAAVHKRLMLLGTIGGLLGPAIKRLPFALGHDDRAMILIAVSLAAAPIYERVTRGRVSALNFWGGLFIYLTYPARMAVGRTEVWHRFAMWLIR